MIYEAGKTIIKLINDCSSIESDGRYKAIHGKVRSSVLTSCLKILFQKLPITQVKFGNTSENVLNENPSNNISFVSSKRYY